jgi:hypothetical protein
MLSSLAVSMPESSQLGPYVVTFDMNTDMPHQLITMEPVQAPSATIYGLQIFTDNNTRASLVISEYKNPIDSTLAVYKQISATNLRYIGYNITSADDKMIDGKDGFLISSMSFPENTMVPAGSTLFEAVYWLDSKGCECGPVSVGTTNVDLTSSYPQDVTMNLVGSLHVAKGESMAQGAQSAQGGQILPPG